MVGEDILTGGILAGFAGLIAGMFILFIILLIAVYIYSAFALMTIAKRTKTENGWLAWIPIANFYLVTQIAKQNPWLTLGILLPIIPIIGSLALAVLTIWLFWQIAERVNMPGWTSILLIIPIVNLVILGIYAWKK